jgi:hypothetical protein
MRDRPTDRLRLSEVLDILCDMYKTHGEMFTNVRAGEVRVGPTCIVGGLAVGPKEVKIK